jgi:hypothetical protein
VYLAFSAPLEGFQTWILSISMPDDGGFVGGMKSSSD